MRCILTTIAEKENPSNSILFIIFSFSVGALIGIIVGGVVLIIVIILVCICWSKCPLAKWRIRRREMQMRAVVRYPGARAPYSRAGIQSAAPPYPVQMQTAPPPYPGDGIQNAASPYPGQTQTTAAPYSGAGIPLRAWPQGYGKQ